MGFFRRKQERAAQISIADPAFVDFFGLGSNLAGVNVSETSSLGVTAVWRAVSVLSAAIANLPLRSYRNLDDGSREQVSSFLDDPAGFESMTPFEWVETVMTHLLLHGNAFLLHVYGGAGQLMGLIPVHPRSVGLMVDLAVPGGKIFQVTLADGTYLELTAVDMTHIPGMATEPNGRGLSPISVARNSMGTTIAGDRAAARLFGNGMLVSGLVTPLEDMTEEEAVQIKDGLRAKTLGVDNAGDIAVINRQLKFERWSMTPEDSQFLESRAFQIDEVARIFGVPPHLLMEMTKQSSWGTGLIEQNQAWARYTLAGWTTRIEQRLSRLLPRPRFCEFDYTGLLRPTPGEEISLLLAEVNGGLITVEEARAVLNLPPIPEQDLRLPPGQVPATGGTV
jgi:HK97 family phage portal protein